MPTMISNNIIRDPRLSYEEVGFLSQLLSFQKSHTYNMTALLSIHNTGKYRVYKIIKHLEALGYIRPHLYKDTTNRWNKSFVVNDNPEFYQMHSYTLIDSDLFRNKELSYKQVGFMIQLISLSLNDNWNYSIEGLASLHNCGFSSAQATLHELKEMNLVKTVRKRENGRICGIRYECAYCYVKEKNGYYFIPEEKKPNKNSTIQIIQPTTKVVIEHRAVYDESFLAAKENRHETLMKQCLDTCYYHSKLKDSELIYRMISENLEKDGTDITTLYHNHTEMISLFTLRKAITENCKIFERTPYFLFSSVASRLRNIIVLLHPKNRTKDTERVLKAERIAAEVYKSLSPQIKLLMDSKEEYIEKLYELAYSSVDEDSTIVKHTNYVSKVIKEELEQEAYEKYVAPIKLLTHFKTVEQSTEMKIIS